MNEFSLPELVRASGKRMREDLAGRLVPHPGERGVDREEVIRQFLRTYLPKRFEVSSGFAFDSKGNCSQQLDIIIANSLVCPRFETHGGTRFYPCESVVAVGQVKSSLRTRRDFSDAMKNLASAKALDRSANGKAVDGTFGEILSPVDNYLHQVFTFLLVTGETLSANTLHEELLKHVLVAPPHTWPNVVFALDRYLATFCCDRGICPNPMDARGVALQMAKDNDEILMRFYLLLGGAIEVTRVGSLPYWEYVQEAQTWSADVLFASTEEPPPYLASISRG